MNDKLFNTLIAALDANVALFIEGNKNSLLSLSRNWDLSASSVNPQQALSLYEALIANLKKYGAGSILAVFKLSLPKTDGVKANEEAVSYKLLASLTELNNSLRKVNFDAQVAQSTQHFTTQAKITLGVSLLGSLIFAGISGGVFGVLCWMTLFAGTAATAYFVYESKANAAVKAQIDAFPDTDKQVQHLSLITAITAITANPKNVIVGQNTGNNAAYSNVLTTAPTSVGQVPIWPQAPIQINLPK